MVLEYALLDDITQDETPPKDCPETHDNSTNEEIPRELSKEVERVESYKPKEDYYEYMNGTSALEELMREQLFFTRIILLLIALMLLSMCFTK